jgi:hypothetical protein
MQLVFRKFSSGAMPAPAPGEIHVRMDPGRAPEGQGIACAVREHGLEVLPRGSGPIERLVIDVALTHPTLDDMLAASFAEQLLRGERLPSGCKVFAEYAAAIRKGLRPADLPPGDSLEGIFLAIRNAAGKDADLTDPQVGERFRKDWARLAACILRAAEQGINPLTTSLFAGQPEFMQERAFLLRDREVYRQDVLRGERWLVRLPGGPAQASGLFLRHPTSLFFPHWSRTDRDAPAGGAYLLLAVNWGEGVWVLSTDPAQRLPILSLAEALQSAEAARDPQGAALDPWYDGRRPEHGHSLIAAPRGGTKLSEAEVLRVVKKWAHARPAARPRPALMIAAAAVALLVLGCLVWALKRPPVPPPTPGAEPPVQVVLSGQDAPLDVGYQRDPRSNLTKLDLVEPELRPNPEPTSAVFNVSFPSPYDLDHVARMWITLQALGDGPLPVMDVTVKVNDGPQQKAAAPVGTGPAAKLTLDVGDVAFRARDNRIEVRIVNPARERRLIGLQLEWRSKGTLYLLAVGVSKYADPRVPELALPSADAQALVQAFRAQEGQVFQKVISRTPIDEKAHRGNILDAMSWLKKSCTALDMAVVALAGHGEKTGGGYFFFAPYDYDPSNKPKNGLSSHDLLVELGELPCNVLLLLDCCHSGAFPNIRSVPARKGMLVFAAARSDEKARASPAWGHGALTLAVLEGIQNKYLFEAKGRRPFPEPLAGGTITLKDLDYFVSRRVRELVGEEQSSPSIPSRDMAPEQIPIALQGPR